MSDDTTDPTDSPKAATPNDELPDIPGWSVGLGIGVGAIMLLIIAVMASPG